MCHVRPFANLGKSMKLRRPRRIIRVIGALGLVAPLVVGFSNSTGAVTSSPFVSFHQFLQKTAGANFPAYSPMTTSKRVANRQAFDEMRSFILDLYQGVKVEHSFIDSDYYVDCIDIMTQPSVRRLGLKKITSPPAPARVTGVPRSMKTAVSPLSTGRHDAYGNAISCPSRTIPMRRASLDLMTDFPTLHDYMAKIPLSGAAPEPIASAPGPGLSPVHPHALGQQWVANHGSNSWLNLWNPSGDFTLSQQWIVGGPDPNDPNQLIGTVEGGWIHDPAAYGPNSVLFIYQTPSNYGDGCWNLECPRPNFVQTSSTWTLGGGFSNYSVQSGTQYGFNEQWNYQGGNWWLFLGTPGQAVGYYPGSSYITGALSHGDADMMEFGGETATYNTASWPQMGSGNWPKLGFGSAAFQANVSYVNAQNTLVSSTLSPYTSNKDCYFIDYTQDDGGPSGTSFYFGGPGGANCGANNPWPSS